MKHRTNRLKLRTRQQSRLTKVNWLILVCVGSVAFVLGLWSLAFISFLTLVLTFMPLVFERFSGINIPPSFTAAINLFIIGTIFLGEVGNFYEMFWWWDVMLHTGSAIGFGLIGFIMIFMMVDSDRLQAAPFILALFAFSFAVSIGAIWEIFEFTMDQIFGSNMQKSGLIDTMYDLVVDCLGGAIGAMTGFLFLKGRELGSLGSVITDFVQANRQLFKNLNNKR